MNSLSNHANARVKRAGQTLIYAPAYDNINMQFNVATPTAESSAHFENLTTATLIHLEEMKKEDLKVMRELWDTKPLN
jgi:hypothetical protein